MTAVPSAEANNTDGEILKVCSYSSSQIQLEEKFEIWDRLGPWCCHLSKGCSLETIAYCTCIGAPWGKDWGCCQCWSWKICCLQLALLKRCKGLRFFIFLPIKKYWHLPLIGSQTITTVQTVTTVMNFIQTMKVKRRHWVSLRRSTRRVTRTRENMTWLMWWQVTRPKDLPWLRPSKLMFRWRGRVKCVARTGSGNWSHWFQELDVNLVLTIFCTQGETLHLWQRQEKLDWKRCVFVYQNNHVKSEKLSQDEACCASTTLQFQNRATLSPALWWDDLSFKISPLHCWSGFYKQNHPLQ